MSKVLVVLECKNGKLDPASLPGITAGQKLAAASGGELHLLVVGAAVEAVASLIAEAGFGAKFIQTAQHPDLDPPTAEAWSDAIVTAVQTIGATSFGGTATSRMRDVLPRVAARLDAPLVTEVTGVTGPSSFRREISAGRAIVELALDGPLIGFTARASDFESAVPGGAPAKVQNIPLQGISRRGTAVLSLERTASSRPALTEADIVVSGGRGMREGKNFAVLERLTDLLGGALGASRAATDAGMVPADLQVGQTGKVVAPKLYIAVAISGAIQHLAGMKGSKTIVAINRDAEAPIFQIADYGLVAKWEDAIPKLTSLVEAHKGAHKGG